MWTYLLYPKTPKHSDTRNIAVVILKFEQCGFTIIIVMCPEDADEMANSVDPEQNAPL